MQWVSLPLHQEFRSASLNLLCQDVLNLEFGLLVDQDGRRTLGLAVDIVGVVRMQEFNVESIVDMAEAWRKLESESVGCDLLQNFEGTNETRGDFAGKGDWIIEMVLGDKDEVSWLECCL